MKTHTVDRCPGCHSDAAVDEPIGDHRLCRCTNCGLVYAPEYADPEEIYVDGYLEGGSGFGLDVRDPSFQEFLAFAARKRLRIIEESVGHRGRLLDVGCGSGELLEQAAKAGWEAVGIDPVQSSVEIAQQRPGITVHRGLLEESDIPQGSFDVVSAFHVLEHMSDGQAFLRSIARWARPGGYVVTEVPNYESEQRRATGSSWPGLRALEHIAHYGPATLRATFERAGLEPVAVVSTGFLVNTQTLNQVVFDLGRLSWAGKLRLLARSDPARPHDPLVPRAVLWPVLRRLEARHGKRGNGVVIIGIGRVP